MPKVIGYHRPASLDEALDLLAADVGPTRIALAGGTMINANRFGDPVEVVDLQGSGLGTIEATGSSLRVGATATLQALADHPVAPPVLAELARREMPSTLRTLGTVGGLVAGAEGGSELLAALLAFGAEVEVVSRDGRVARELDEVLLYGPAGIITAVVIPLGGRAAAARTGRTPGDSPIVAAVGHRPPGGELRIAMCGVGEVPVIVGDPGEVSPPSDFRGSSAYRHRLAAVLAARVAAALE